MRLDKYMKTTRIIRRRTVANEAAGAGRISVNGRVAKPSTDVKPGDILEIRFGSKVMRVRADDVSPYAKKADASSLYTVLSEDGIEDDSDDDTD